MADVPLPDAGTVNLLPPDAHETELLARACATAAAAPDGITEVQRAVINATVESMSGFVLDVAELPPYGPTSSRRRCGAATERSGSAWCR